MHLSLFLGQLTDISPGSARQIHCRYSLGKACLFSRDVVNEEIRHRRVLEELIDFLEMQAIRKKTVASLPYGLMKRVELGRALAFA